MGANNNKNAAGRLVPTGRRHRRNITSASLVALDAPTQVQNYLTPSSTSKKEIPSTFVVRRNKLKAKEAAVTKAPALGPSTVSRKRTRDEAGGDEVDQLQDDDISMSGGNNNNAASSSTTPSSPTGGPVPAELASESSSLLSAIEAKRRQNTLVARRSRQRKLDYVRNLEELVSALTRERDSWNARAEGAEKILGYRPDEDEMDEAQKPHGVYRTKLLLCPFLSFYVQGQPFIFPPPSTNLKRGLCWLLFSSLVSDPSPAS